MPNHIYVGNYDLKVRDLLVATENASRREICDAGTVVSVHRIVQDGGELLVGLVSRDRIYGWGDLWGRVMEGHGFWASTECLLDNFRPLNKIYTIKATVYKGKNLDGKDCKLIYPKKDYAFVELFENVGGGGADGLGRMGHCIVVEQKKLMFKKKQAIEWEKGRKSKNA